MKPRVRWVSVALAALLASQPVLADPMGSYWTLTPLGGYTIFDGNLKYRDGIRTNPPENSPSASLPGRSLADDIYVGGRLGYQYNSWLGFELAGGFTPTSEDTANGHVIDFMHGSGNVMVTPWRGLQGGPFLFLGAGGARVKPSAGGEDFDQGTVEAGGGINYWVTDLIALRLEGRTITWIPKDSNNDNLTYVVLGGGLSLALGAKGRDSDGDGVPDRKDKCPDTPAGALVDSDGCPLDTDGDAVFDGLDKCPDTPKGCVVDATGCSADADGDGVCDGIDTCPDTPKGCLVDATGCPVDADGDGVCDGLDKCPATPAGCVVDSTSGCPIDTDGDGVCDGLDKCPDTTPGLQVDETGCPIEIVIRETELLDTGMIRLGDVNFATGKADITPDSHASLDVVAEVLLKWPELKIEIGGHTDSRGSAETNRSLSNKRAKAVYDYLMQKFPDLNEASFSVKGYGEDRPVVPNTNDLNMSKNRRVEFVVQNKDVLRREIERRQLLQKGAPADTTSKP
jgi:outer membrane protein OmpA-like peptidoglycan-associated protein/opacity protein-like surface antigen